MKALTLRHPWAWAVCYLGKPVENRTWMPSPRQLRPGEKFAIHAGKMPSKIEIAEALAWMDFEGLLHNAPLDKVPAFADLRTQESAIVAVATFGGIVTEHPSPWFCGPYGWVLDDLVVLPAPVACRGAQGLWNLPPDVLEETLQQFRPRDASGIPKVGTGAEFTENPGQ